MWIWQMHNYLSLNVLQMSTDVTADALHMQQKDNINRATENMTQSETWKVIQTSWDSVS